MGKSGAIGRKLAVLFLALALHRFSCIRLRCLWRLGVLTQDDVLLALSYSGESDELVSILPVIVRIGVDIISIVGNLESTLARYSQSVLDVNVEREACPFNLAPTAMQRLCWRLGMLRLLLCRSAGSPKRISQKYIRWFAWQKASAAVSDVMRTGDAIAVVSEDALVRDTVQHHQSPCRISLCCGYRRDAVRVHNRWRYPPRAA